MALTGVYDDRRKGPTHAFGHQWYPVAAGVLIWKGAIVAVDANGYARPARGNAADVVVGIAFETFDNTTGQNGASAQVSSVAGVVAGGGRTGVRVWKHGNFALPLAGAVQANVGKPVYATDDNTLSLTAATGQLVGTIQELRETANSVRVLIDGKVS